MMLVALLLAGVSLAAPSPPSGAGPGSGCAFSGSSGKPLERGRTRVLIGMDGNARRPGDLITVDIDEDAR